MRLVKSIFLILVLIGSISLGVFADDHLKINQHWDDVPSSELKMDEGKSAEWLFVPSDYCDYRVRTYSGYNHDNTRPCGGRANTDFDLGDNYKSWSKITVSENAEGISCNYNPSYSDPGNGYYNWNSNDYIKCSDTGFTGTSFTLTVHHNAYIWNQGNGDGAYNIISKDHSESWDKDFTITVRQSNDKPTTEATTINVDRGTTYTFTASDFPYTDEESDTFSTLKINPASNEYGVFKYDGNTLPIYQFKTISSNNINKLTFVPTVTTSNGAKEVALFYVIDQGGGESYNAMLSINVKYKAADLSFSDLPDYELEEDFTGGKPYPSLTLDPYCPEGETFEIIDQTNPDIINCKIERSGSYLTSKFQCRSVKDGFGTNTVTISCNEGDSTPVNQDISIEIENSYDPTSITATPIDITVTEGSSKNIILPISNPDKITNLQISTKSAPGKSSTAISYEYDEETNNYFANYVPWTDATGQDTFNYSFSDGNTERIGEVRITISNVNDIPLSYDNSIDVTEDEYYTFNERDFPFADPGDQEPFHGIRILSYPNKGDLKLGTQQVSLYQTIRKEQISGISYTPEEDSYGDDYTRFLFSVSDGSSNSAAHTLTINVEEDNDPPTITPIIDVDIREDSKDNRIFLNVEDIDGDTLDYTFTSSDQLLIKNSNIKQTGSGNNPILLITPEEDVSARTATISVFIDDGNGGYAEDAFDVYILPVNDAPLSGDFEKSAYVYDVIEFTQSDFPFSDLDDVLSTSSSFDKIEIITLPTKGDLKYNDESITAITSIPFDQIDKLSFELPEGLTATDSFTFRVSDFNEYSEVHTATLNILESQYGLNSQPAYLGGYPIFNTGWACKPGYELKQELSTLTLLLGAVGEVCIEHVNTPPVANISLSVETAGLNSIIYFSGSGSSDSDGSIESYEWQLASNKTKTGERVSHFYTSITDCPGSMCTIKLTVTDDQGDSDVATTQLRLSSKSNETAPDYSNIVAIEGKSYTDGELAHLGLTSGTTRVKGDTEITVDSSGKIIKMERIISEYDDPLARTTFIPFDGQCQAGEKESSTPLDCIKGDGVCSESKGETSMNSPDCSGNSKTGLLVLLLFVTIIGGGVFYAWKKGILGKHNLSIGSKPTPTASSFETVQPVKPRGPEQYIRTQRAKGFSNEQIRGALKNKGWDDDKIDEALNSSRE